MSAKSRRNISSSSGLRLFWNRKTRQFVAISIQVTTGGYRDGTAFLSGIIYAPANGSRWHRRKPGGWAFRPAPPRWKERHAARAAIRAADRRDRESPG